jgi:hypothetical protein
MSDGPAPRRISKIQNDDSATATMSATQTRTATSGDIAKP